MTRARGRDSPVRLVRQDSIAIVSLGRGGGDVLDDALTGALAAVADDIRHADDVRVVVLEADTWDGTLGRPSGTSSRAAGPDGIAAVAALEQPVVCAVRGRVVEAGLALALAADLIVAEAGARFVAVDPGFGCLPGGGLAPRLARRIGPARATAMLLLGTSVDGREALRWGLVQRLAPKGRARAAARRLARDLARQGPVALRYAKEACRRALDMPLDQGMRLEHDLYVLLQTTADRREGVDAFRMRRSPRFQGR